MPDKLPDLSNHSSFFAEVMKANPGLYDKLKTKNIKLGVTFGHCIKTGVDNPGHPMIKTVGAVAGDEESYELFKDFFDPVISARHGGYAADAKHPTDMNPANLSTLLLSSGCGRHWPDARDIFHNEAQNFFVWVNEEE